MSDISANQAIQRKERPGATPKISGSGTTSSNTDTKKTTSDAKDDKKKKDSDTPKQPVVQYEPSPIKKQHRDLRSQTEENPVKIIFLDGAYAGNSIDLGVGIENLSHGQTAEWEEHPGEGIRNALNFKRISTRDISMSVTFYDLKFDIAHLVENLYHMQEISEGSATPPTLLLVQGDLRATKVHCTSIRPKYDHPFLNGKGLHWAQVELEFKLAGGKGSPDVTAPPLTGTPLADIRRQQTALQRQRLANAQTTKLLLAPCLGDKGSEPLIKLLEDNKQENPDSILSLPPSVFIQGAIGGIFSKKTLSDPKVAEKLKNDWAAVLAQAEDGAGFESRKLAEAIINNDPSRLSSKLQQQFDQIAADYKTTLGAIASQDLGQDSNNPVFNLKTNPTALSRLNKAGRCGLSLRNKGKTRVTGQGIQSPADEKSQLDAINKLIQDRSTSDEVIKRAFGASTPSEIKILRNSVPFTSKSQFIQDASRANTGLTGYAMWSNFGDYQKNKEGGSDKSQNTN